MNTYALSKMEFIFCSMYFFYENPLVFHIGNIIIY